MSISKNPVFSRIEQEQKQGQFATFRTGPTPAAPPPTSGDLEQMYAGPPPPAWTPAGSPTTT